MSDKFSEDFIKALKNHDKNVLLTLPKSDLHNHLGRGCTRQWLSKKLNHDFPPPPEKFDGLIGMQNWYVGAIRDYCRAHDALNLRREGCFAEAQRNHLARFAPSFSDTDIEDFGGVEDFTNYWDMLCEKYCPDAVYEPELAFASYADVEADVENAEKYFASGYFK